MTVSLTLFYFFAAFTVGAALIVVLGRNIVRSAVALIFSFTGVASLYILLDAEFLAAAQVLIYVGGITILLLFAIMLTVRISSPGTAIFNTQVWWSGAAVLGILTLILLAAARGFVPQPVPPPLPNTTVSLGRALLTTYALPFEVVSILLLVGMVGAILLARKEKE